MAQHQAYSLYVTTRWQGRAGYSFAGETAMWGIRLGTDTGIPDLATGTRDLQAFLVNDAATTSTTTHLTKSQGWTGDASGGTNVTDADQDAIAEASWAFCSAIQSLLPSTYSLESIRLYALDQATRSPVAPCVYTPTAAMNGSGTQMLPAQDAMVLSTGSATIGRHGRGRIFVGPLALSALGTDGKFASSSLTTALGAFQTYLNALRMTGTGPATAYFPIVLHRNTTNASVINKVRVGNMVDSQHRRREQVAETYSSLNLS